MLKAPTFNLPLGSEVSGDDPLGLAPVNERLYGSVFPGINNAVRYIRIYSLICWVAWKFEDYLRQHPDALTDLAVKELFSSMVEKIELLVTWVNNGQSGLEGLVGTRRKFPQDDKQVTLRFDAFGENEAAYFSPGQYKPSLTSGLGFLTSKEYDTFACTEDGHKLAVAVDELLKSNPRYKWLCNVTAYGVKRSQVMEMKSLFSVLKPSRAERMAFLSRLVPDCHHDEDKHPDANRRSGMVLTLRAVSAINKYHAQRRHKVVIASEDDIRAAMARGCAPDGKVINLSGTERAQAKWAVLQLRQYQRACIEAFYVAIEYLLSGSVELVDRTRSGVATLIGRYCEEGFVGKRSPVVGDVKSAIRGLQGGASTLYQASLNNQDADVFESRNRLRYMPVSEVEGLGMPLLAEALQGLVFCATEASNLALVDGMRSYLEMDQDKLPLSAMPDLISRFMDRPVCELAAYVARHYVIERHYEVVTMRSQVGDAKNRFRFIEGESGLHRYDDNRKLPGLEEAQDRLARAIDLLVQCGLLQEKEGGYTITAAGESYI